MTRRTGLALALFLLVVPQGYGQEWAKEMFDHTTHDFGTVARGAKVEHRFTLENIFEEDAHIASISSSCGCTNPQVTKRTLKTWEKSEIVAIVDTRAYQGRKDATLTVIFDKPFPAEVQLHVHTYIRSDVVVQPGVIQFGTVSQGTRAKQRVGVSYAGRANWRIERAECANPYLEAQLVPAAQGTGQINYDLWVTLKDTAPAGYVRDHVILVTNDFSEQASRVPVPVEGIVKPAVSVRPSPLWLGVVRPGGQVTRQLVVQGAKPFRVVSATAADGRFQCKIPEVAKALQLVPVTFTASDVTGKVSTKIRIETEEGMSDVLEVDAHVRVMVPDPVPASDASGSAVPLPEAPAPEFPPSE